MEISDKTNVSPKMETWVGNILRVGVIVSAALVLFGIYAKQKDTLYIIISSIVLCLLIYSLVLAR